MSAGTEYVPPGQRQYVQLFVGNSIGDGTGGVTPYPTRFSTHPTQAYNTVVNACAGGQSLATLNTNFATIVGPYAPALTGKPLNVFLYAPGGVDLDNGEAAATVLARIQTFKDAVTALSVTGLPAKLFLSTVPPGAAFAGAPDVQRLALNVLIEASTTAWDYLVMLARLTPTITDTTIYQGDQQHYTNGGQEVALGGTMTAVTGQTFQGFAPTQYFANIMVADAGGGFIGGAYRTTSGIIGCQFGAELFSQTPTGGWRWFSSTLTADIFKLTDAGAVSWLGSMTAGTGGTAIAKILHGTATLSSGTVTVSNANTSTNSRIFVNRFTDGGTVGSSYSVTRVNATSFTITSKEANATQTLDTSVVSWVMVNP